MDPGPALNRLRRQWSLLWIAAAGGLASGLLILAQARGAQPAGRWGLQAGLVLAYVLVRLGRNLKLNHRPGDHRLLPSLGAANGLTCLRACLVAALAGFLFPPPAAADAPPWLTWAPGVIYLAVVVLDFGDGFIARTTGRETRLGAWLDTETDALGLLVAALLLVESGKAPAAFLSVGVGYYALRMAIRLRRMANRPIGEIAPRAGARLVAGCAMGFTAASLMPVFSAAATAPAAWVMTIALLASLAQDWLIVCGYTKTSAPLYGDGIEAYNPFLVRAVPLALRTAVAAGMIMAVDAWPGNAGAATAPMWTKALAVTAGAACTVGVAGRAAAVILSLLTAGWLCQAVPGSGPVVVLVAAMGMIMTGAGSPRLWQPEDRFLLGKHGGKTRRGQDYHPAGR